LNVKKRKFRDIYLCGVSLGANNLGNLIGDDGERCKAKAAVCFQPPMWLNKTME